MSQRFLKYETEAGNPMVDENGVLLAGGSGDKKRIEILNNTTLSTFDQEPSGDYTKYIYMWKTMT